LVRLIIGQIIILFVLAISVGLVGRVVLALPLLIAVLVIAELRGLGTAVALLIVLIVLRLLVRSLDFCS